MRQLCVGLFVLLWTFVIGLSGAPSPAWKIEKVNLTPHTEHENMLSVKISRNRSEPSFEISSAVTLTSVDESFISGDRLVVLGEAGRVQAVVIFDLLRKEKIDWFFCYYPQHVSGEWIVYVRWLPPRATGDVVLLYDLTKSPTQNRVESKSHLPIPAPNTAAPVDVGVPIYPDFNRLYKSYWNFKENGASSKHTLAHSFALLPPGRLVFVSVDITPENGVNKYRDWLVVINLSAGIPNANSKTLPIPKDLVKNIVKDPDFVPVERIESVSPNKIRLHIRDRAESILVDIPES
jgi:hypothetical protein